MIALAIFISLGLISWIIWEAFRAPTLDDWHDECVKSRKKKDT